MRYGITVIILLMACFLAAETIQYDLHFNAPDVVQHRGETLISFDNTMQSGLPGEPTLPYRAVRLMLPPSSTVADITVYREDPIQLEGSWSLFPTQAVRPISKGGDGNYLRDNKVYTSSVSYPSRYYGDVKVDYYRGYGFASVSVTPVEYIPAEGSVTYYSTIRIEIETKPDYRSDILPVSARETVRLDAEKFAENPSMSSRYMVPAMRSSGYEMLIVTSDDYMDDFDPLVELYAQKGIRCQKVTIDEATGSQTGQDDQEKLRNYIIQEYTQNDIEYVLLGGDVDIIQYRGFFCQVESGGIVEDNNIPSDLYYSALDGTWNDDDDNLWGEIGEDDLLPDVAVGRMPFDNHDEFDAMLNKIMMYQTEPVEDELDQPLLVGENLWDDPLTWGGDLIDTIVGECDIAGYTTNGIPDSDPFERLYDRDHGEWSTGELINAINEGHPYIHHSGHSNSSYNMRLMIFQISNNNFANVNGTDHNFTNVYSHGCIAGSFEEEDCIGERMVLIDNFAASYIGNSRYGWFNEGQLEGPSQHLHREYTDALYNDGVRQIGMAHLVSRIMTAPYVNAPGQHEQGALRWCFYDCNVLGDPAMSIWCEQPHEITATFDEPLPIGSTSMQVDVESTDGNAEGIVCTLIQDDEVIGSGITDASGTVVIFFDAPVANTGQTTLYVSGNDILIHQYEVEIAEVEDPWIALLHVDTHDDNNQIPEYEENIYLDITVQNIGQAACSDLTAYLYTDDEYINLAGLNASFSAMASGDSVTSTNAFNFDTSDGIPDQHEALLYLVFVDHPEWSLPFTITFAAPELACDDWAIDHYTSGRSGFLFPGDPNPLYITIGNQGSATSPEISTELTLLNGQATISPYVDTSAPLEGGENVELWFDITPDISTQTGSILTFELEVDAGAYSFTRILEIPAGELWELFDNFTDLPWQFTGEGDWTIDDEGFESNQSARSGDIGDDESSGLTITMEDLRQGTISFHYKVSSEADYDHLRFFIDDIQMGMWSGDTGWQEKVCPVTDGTHAFTWLYTKDAGASDGDDCAWVDAIIFPPHETWNAIDTEEMAKLVKQGLTNYPNPFNPETTFAFALEEPSHVSLEIFNIRGQRVRKLLDERMQNGIHHAVWQGRDDTGRAVSSGVYFARIITATGAVVKKIAMIK